MKINQRCVLFWALAVADLCWVTTAFVIDGLPSRKAAATCFRRSGKVVLMDASSDDNDDFYSDFDPQEFNKQYENRRYAQDQFSSSTQSSYGGNRRSGGDYGRGRGGDYGGGRGRGRGDYGRRGGSGSQQYERDTTHDESNIDVDAVNALIQDRANARKRGDFDEADAIRDTLLNDYSVKLWDRERIWRSGCSASGSGGRLPERVQRGPRRERRQQDFGPNGHDYEPAEDAGPIVASLSEDEIHSLLAERLQAKLNREFQNADRIQEELASAGVYVHDGRKEWRADGNFFGDSASRSGRPGREPGSRNNDRNQPYTKSAYSQEAGLSQEEINHIEEMVERRNRAKLSRDYSTADDIRAELKQEYNVYLEDRMRQWSINGDFGPDAPKIENNRDRPWAQSKFSESADDNEDAILAMLQKRDEAKEVRDFRTADGIRDDLLSDYNVVVNDRFKEWSVGGVFGPPSKDDPNRRFVRRGGGKLSEEEASLIADLVEERAAAKKDRNFDRADAIRDQLEEEFSVKVDDRSREWRVISEDYVLSEYSTGVLDDETLNHVQEQLKKRSAYKAQRNYDAADAIRDQLRAEYSVTVDDRTREFSITVDEYSRVERDGNQRVIRKRASAPDDFTVEDNDEDFEIEAAVDSMVEEKSDAEENQDVGAGNSGYDAEYLESLTVVKLKELLKESGLPVSGKKAELVERLTSLNA